jgi:HSP20 family protein
MAVLVRRVPRTNRPTQRWDPFRELEELNERLGELVGDSGQNGDVWTPLADIEETDDMWVVELELPGVKREDVDIELNDSEVIVTGEIKEREREGILRRRTRPVGRFEYRVTLPGDVDPDNVLATMAEGILRLRIPKLQRSQARRIEVSSE